MDDILLECAVHEENGNIRIATTKLNEKFSQNQLITLEIKSNSEYPQTFNFGVPFDNITSLVLSHRNLSYLPNSLCSPNLIELDLSYNCFQDVPECVFNRALKLQILNLSYNHLTSFSMLPKCSKELRRLNISYNYIYDIPYWIFGGHCPDLEILDMSNNPFKTFLPFLTGQSLRNLHTLIVRNCRFCMRYVKFLQEIPNLKTLIIGNDRSEDHLNTIQTLPFGNFHSVMTLIELDMSSLGMSSLTEEICLLEMLKKLNVSHNHLSWLPKNFAKLKSLEIFNISQSELICLPVDIGEMINLSELYLSENMLSSLPQSLTKLDNLKVLDCYNNYLEEDALDIINQLTSLHSLDLEYNFFETTQSETYVSKRERLRNYSKIRFLGLKKEDPIIEQCGTIYGNLKFSLSNSLDEDRVEDEYEDRSEDNDDEDRGEENDIEGNESKSVEEEENWDSEVSNEAIPDNNLLLVPYKYKIVCKPKPFDPSDYIDPACFEDSLDDLT